MSLTNDQKERLTHLSRVWNDEEQNPDEILGELIEVLRAEDLEAVERKREVRKRLIDLLTTVSDWDSVKGLQFGTVQRAFILLVDILLAERADNKRDDVSEDREDTPADYEDDGEIEGRDYNCNQEDEDKPIKQRPYKDDVFTLTLKREIKLFKRLLKGRPVELTDASPETATIREILECEGVVIIEREGKTTVEETEYDLSGSVFWNRDKTVALIRWRF